MRTLARLLRLVRKVLVSGPRMLRVMGPRPRVGPAPLFGLWDAWTIPHRDFIRLHEMQRDIERHDARRSNDNSDPAP